MKYLIYCFLLFAFVACTMALESSSSYFQVTSGSIHHIDSFPSEYISSRNIEIWLPDGYTKKEKYAVLYMHDGQMLFDSSKTWNNQEWEVDEVMGRLQREGVIQSTIVVGIWNIESSRHSDYFPQKPFMSLPKIYQDSLINQAKTEGKTPLFGFQVQSDNYLKFIVEELKPYIDQQYSTHTDQEHTFIAGSSMGGLISMYAICEYPDVLGGAACISTHWPGTFTVENNPIPKAFQAYMNTHLPDPKTHKIYFDYGTETLDAMYEPLQIQVDSEMIAKGFTPRNWITRKFIGENHSENSWKKRLDIPLKFLLGV